MSSSSPTFAQLPGIDTHAPAWLNGITLDDVQNLKTEQWDALKALETVTVVRVVFDANTEPEQYVKALDDLRALRLKSDQEKRKIYIMGEILDSDDLARYRWECKESEDCFTGENRKHKFHDYKTRVTRYLEVLHKQVDIWEVGNEVNGEWADEGCVKKSNGDCITDLREEKDATGQRLKSVPNPIFTARKILYAIDAAKSKNKPVALTLMHQPECTTWDRNTMSEWARTNLRPLIDSYTIDYLLISYYEDNCDEGKRSIASEDELTREEKTLPKKEREQRRRDIYWTRTFKELQGLFSKVRYVGFGEVGYSSDVKTCSDDVLSYCKDRRRGSKLELLSRYYGMKVNVPNYIGGHFWWNAQEDIAYSEFYSRMTGYFKQ